MQTERERITRELEDKYDLCDCTGGWVLSFYEIADIILADRRRVIDEVTGPLKKCYRRKVPDGFTFETYKAIDESLAKAEEFKKGA